MTMGQDEKAKPTENKEAGLPASHKESPRQGGQPAQAAKATAVKHPPAEAMAEKFKKPLPRRDFLAISGWGALLAFGGICNYSLLKFMFPNVTYEPPQAFKAGRPEDYAVGVDERWKSRQRVWIVRNNKGLYALWARCTHLGCTPNWHENAQRIQCPCHGSNFNLDGDVVAGPAPIPLWRCAITLAPDGQILVDKGLLENRLGLREQPPFFLPA